ncbi:hypothetical protein Droror1_Dr00005833 [Drosera rotundifolia]
MTAALRLLSAIASSPVTAEEPETVSSKSDYVVVLAALSCALICTVGLALVARCACVHRRLSSATSASGHSIRLPSPPPPPGLKKKILKSLPTATYAPGVIDEGNISDCAICLSDFSTGDLLRVLPQCGHVFHVKCIDTWLGCHSSCPSCRELVLVTSLCTRCRVLQDSDHIAIGLKTGQDYANGFLP